MKPRRREKDLPPGLRATPLDMSQCRQLVHHFVQSTAVHSKSKGWLPMVKVDLDHIPLAGPGRAETLQLLIRPRDLKELRRVLDMAMLRAAQDAEVGLVDD